MDGRTGSADAGSAHGARVASLLLVTPCRDEAAYARRTLDSVVRQTVRPAQWTIVDDGSTDQTPSILAEYAARHPWIQVVRREDRGRRSVGPGVIDAFYAGYATARPERFEHVCKLDLDLDLPPRYFEILLERMANEPRLGTCSGKPYFEVPGRGLVSEGCGDEMSVGMTKLYRRECFEAIGGFVRHVMWDGIDCHRARMLGWIARSWDEPELRFVHLRPMGSSHRGILTGRFRHGHGQWFMGTGLAYMTASALYRCAHRPWILGGLAMWAGYVASGLRGAARLEDRALREFIQRYQRRCLWLGKRRATRAIEELQAHAWRRSPEAAP
ncbi:MAG: glycosyltransferase family 2 protein [Planctomycetes bacterium]|nr:glycosyltransferase family 2 protein [Planctomycetota bacterium]